MQALKTANVEACAGKIGENSDRGRSPLEYAVKYTGKFITPEQYARIPIRANADGEIVRVSDVARVEFDTAFFDVESRYNGRPSAALVLKQLPHSNAREVIDQVKKTRLAQMKREVFLPGMDYELSFDVSRFLDASVQEVVKTFLEAFLLVAFVVFLFLQDWRSTLIPLIAVPVSLVGTFAIISAAGVLTEPHHAVRAGAGHRHRRRQRHRGGRGGARAARPRPGRERAGGDRGGDARNRRRHHRHHPRDVGGLRARRLHQRARGRLLSAVLGDDGRGHHLVGRRRGDAHAGAVRVAPQAHPQVDARPARVVRGGATAGSSGPSCRWWGAPRPGVR